MKTKTLLAFAACAIFPHAASATDLSWIAGAWCGTLDGSRIEERWGSGEGALMLGVSKTYGKKPRAEFEFMRIELDGPVPAYVAQPGGGPPVRFALSEAKPGFVRFSNPDHDFPKRITYRRTGDAMRATIDDGTDGNAMTYEWVACSGSAVRARPDPSRPGLHP
ncbi:MAG TPA: DUF6265 family protein [Xanthomonadales bacterium]|nr:DUF6265 family protein [Xanthomonadales bacterium]